MTTPGQAAPDGAYVVGSNYGSDITDASARAMMTDPTTARWNNNNNGMNAIMVDWSDRFNQLRDAQLDLSDRVDLLDGVSGYCSLFMDHNWDVPSGRYLPFNTQLGPNKNAAPNGVNAINLFKAGLWRADAHVNFYPAPSGWGATPASIQLQLQVWSWNGGSPYLYTVKEYDIVVSTTGSETAAWPHTFVIPDDWDNAAATGFYVLVYVTHNKGSHKVYGGTMRSALSVNRWGTGVENLYQPATVPDGGSL